MKHTNLFFTLLPLLVTSRAIPYDDDAEIHYYESYDYETSLGLDPHEAEDQVTYDYYQTYDYYFTDDYESSYEIHYYESYDYDALDIDVRYLIGEVTRQNAEMLRLELLVGQHSKAFNELLKGLQRAVP